MKKIVLILAMIFATAIFLSSCSSQRGPKCPGMYSKVQNVEQQKAM